jgi:hypothetical protein
MVRQDGEGGLQVSDFVRKEFDYVLESPHAANQLDDPADAVEVIIVHYIAPRVRPVLFNNTQHFLRQWLDHIRQALLEEHRLFLVFTQGELQPLKPHLKYLFVVRDVLDGQQNLLFVHKVRNLRTQSPTIYFIAHKANFQGKPFFFDMRGA